MKIIISLVATIALSCGAIAMPNQNTVAEDGELVSVLKPARDIANSVVQDESQSEPQAEPPIEPVATPPAPPEAAPAQDAPPVPVPDQPVPAQSVPAELEIEGPSAIMDSVLIEAPLFSEPGGCCQSCCNDPCDCCQPCCEQPCCCPPTPTVFCLEDPCGCCHEACINVPACCVNEQPQVDWRGGLFGRQVAIVCWECCGHRVKVIVTRRGKVKVRG